MNKRNTLNILCSAADRKLLGRLEEQLSLRGIRLDNKKADGKNGVVLAVLSENFYSDDALTDTLLSLIGTGAENVLPLQLDGAPIPDRIKNALYARNIIPAAGREPSLIAERIVSSLPREKSRLPFLLSAAGIVLLALVGLLIWRAVQKGSDSPSLDGNQPVVVPSALGITEEDLESIENVVIVGDQIAFFRSFEIKNFATNGDILFVPENAFQTWDYFAYLDEWNDVHWYSKETGQELGPARWEDLRFIGLMPNLRSLTLVLVDTDETALPDLREAENLERVDIESCSIETLDWMAGSSAEEITIRFTPVRDFSPLTDCGKLERLSVDMYGQSVETGFSDFAPPELNNLWLWHANSGGNLDLSSLRSCGELFCVTLGDLPLRDLSFLAEARKISILSLSEMNGLNGLPGIEGLPIERLEITNCSGLREIRAVSELKSLQSLYIESCGRLTDFSPAGGCSALERFHVWGMNEQIRDVSFLAELKNLRWIDLYDVDLANMEFLSGLSDAQELNLEFSGETRDFSGLSYVKNYGILHINPPNGNLEAVLPYLQGATVKHLHLHGCRGIDLNRLPEVTEGLEIWYGDLQDLSGMPAFKIQDLQLYDLPYLNSLKGIENLPNYSKPWRNGRLRITGCPRLNDWSPIEGIHLDELRLEHVYTLPNLERADFSNLLIEGVDALTDLRFLETKPDGWNYNWIRLVDENGLRDLSPLKRMNGERLTVDPALAEQAEELQEMECVREYSIEYPDGSWHPFEGTVSLLSLDELDTLPEAMLRKVDRLCIVGDQLVDMDEYDVNWRREDGKALPVVTLFDRDTGEESVLEYSEGSVTDLSRFAVLSSLKELRLYAQPLENLSGIQNLSELEALNLTFCESLTDASAAFACQQIRYLCIDNCPIESIEGVQNLSELVDLNINGTLVRDISPLRGCNLAAAIEERGGLALYISDVPIEDYSPLSTLGALSNLDINNVDAALYIPYLENIPIRRLSSCGCFTKDSAAEDPNALFAGFLYAHPGLTELWIPWNPAITDLTPLLDLGDLEYVRVSYIMEEAIGSLRGAELGFDFEIEG